MFSTKGRYAIRLMIDLAEHNTDKPIPLDEIALRQDISKKYLESIVKILVSGKLIKGTSGKGGGYHLTRKPNEYTIYEILSLTEGSLTAVACLNDDADICPRMNICKTIGMWQGYDKLTQKYFSGITIEDLI